MCVCVWVSVCVYKYKRLCVWVCLCVCHPFSWLSTSPPPPPSSPPPLQSIIELSAELKTLLAWDDRKPHSQVPCETEDQGYSISTTSHTLRHGTMEHWEVLKRDKKTIRNTDPPHSTWQMLGHGSRWFVWSNAIQKPCSGGTGPSIKISSGKTGQKHQCGKGYPNFFRTLRNLQKPNLTNFGQWLSIQLCIHADIPWWLRHRWGINLQNIPPLHPSSNPAETFMRPQGKTMKTAHNS